MNGRWIRMAALLVCVVTAGCIRDAPFVPGTSFSVSGHVKLRGYFVDDAGNFTGTRIIGDADGVPVDLLYGSDVVARATSRGGVYRFDGIAPGGYVVRARVIPGIEWQTRTLVVTNADLAVADTLRLSALGDLFPVPNPFVDSFSVVFQVRDTTEVKLALLDVGTQPVRTIFDHLIPPATYTVPVKLPPIPASSSPILYWLTYSGGPDMRAQLLVRESGAGASQAAVRTY